MSMRAIIRYGRPSLMQKSVCLIGSCRNADELVRVISLMRCGRLS